MKNKKLISFHLVLDLCSSLRFLARDKKKKIKKLLFISNDFSIHDSFRKSMKLSYAVLILFELE